MYCSCKNGECNKVSKKDGLCFYKGVLYWVKGYDYCPWTRKPKEVVKNGKEKKVKKEHGRTFL